MSGHLAGIIVGLLYIKGPLKYVLDSVIPPGKCTNPSETYSMMYFWPLHFNKYTWLWWT